MERYDVVVIGAGPAGYICAIRAAQLGQTTAIVDRQWLGGVCLNVGCIPSKALLKNAEIAYLLRERSDEFGFSFDNLVVDYRVAVRRARQVSERLARGVASLLEKNHVSVYTGGAKLVSRDRLSLVDNDGNEIYLRAKNIVVATGAHAIVPQDWKVDGNRVVTYLEAIAQEKLPKSAIIIGSGAIGVEFATIWRSYGVDVTIIEMLPRLVPLEDEEISAELAKAFTKKGIRVYAGHKVESVEATETGVKVKVSKVNAASENEKAVEQTLEAEQALVAIGFHPNSKGLGLEELGVELSERGFVHIDERMATNVAGIWAIGDVTGKLMLAHVGSAQGIVCAENMAGAETVKLNYEMMPRATYCQPQVASFGLSEAQARERGFPVQVGRYSFRANGKALGLGDSEGWVKIITDERSEEILGAHMIGPEVTELLPELTLAQMLELTPAEIVRNVHAHPTLGEVLVEAVNVAKNGHG